MKLSILIPYRPDTSHRARIHGYTSTLWKDRGVEVVYASDGLTGSFSYAKAINIARKQATGDCFLSYSVDALPPSRIFLAGLASILESGIPWVAGWRGQARFTDVQTQLILTGNDLKNVGTPAGGICLGREALVAVRADIWDELRGYDERFIGWGPEDKAWHASLQTLHPSGWDKPESDHFFKTLWHPSVPRVMLPQNNDIFREYRRECQSYEGFRRWYYFTRHNPPHFT